MNRPARPPGSSSGGTQTLKAIAVVGVVVLVGWLALYKGTKAPTTTTTAATHPSRTTTTLPSSTVPTTTVPLLPPSSIKVQVLNGVGTGTYAGQWSNKLRTKYGYNTLAPDDATSRVIQSVIYVVTLGYLPEAQALATAVGLPATAINSANPLPANAPIRTSERATANLVLVIGQDLAGSA